MLENISDDVNTWDIIDGANHSYPVLQADFSVLERFDLSGVNQIFNVDGKIFNSPSSRINSWHWKPN